MENKIISIVSDIILGQLRLAIATLTIEEIEAKDLEMYGVGGLIERRTANQERAMERYFDRAFFTEAVTQGTALTVEGSPTIDAEIEQAIEAVETVQECIKAFDDEFGA